MPRVTATWAWHSANKGSSPRLVSSLERGHELGSRRKDWPYPSAEWVRQCRELLQRNSRPR